MRGVSFSERVGQLQAWGQRALAKSVEPSFIIVHFKCVRQALKAVSIAYKGDPSKKAIRGRVKVASLSLYTVSFFLSYSRVPGKVYSMYTVSVLLVRDTHSIISCFRDGRSISKKKVIKNIGRVFYLINGAAGLSKKTVYGPVKFIDKFHDLGPIAGSMSAQWNVICLIKRGSKIGLVLCKIAQGKKVKKYTFQLIVFHLPGLTFDILKLADVVVPPEVKISFGIVKSSYKLVKGWEGTV